MVKPYYDQDGVTLYHGDCREVLPRLHVVTREAMVICDPPYGIAHKSGFEASWQNTQIANDGNTVVRDWIIDNLAPLPMVIFGTWKVQRPKCRAVLIWDKGPASGMGDLSFPWKGSFEEIYILGDGWRGRRDEGVLRGHTVVTWESKGRGHPNEKPVSLASHFVTKHDAPLVVDPTCGTGFALQAAKLCGKRAIGIELDERHCETVVRRLAQGVLFGVGRESA